MFNVDNFAFDSNLGSPFKSYIAVWVHGCARNCPGCIAKQRNDDPEPCFSFSPEFFARFIMTDRAKNADGLVISGGEPFLQSADLVKFIIEAKRISGRDLDVVCYTGFKYEELLSKVPSARELLALTDVLIDGEYRKEQNSGSRYKGSDNQRILFLSDKYSQADFPEDIPRKITINTSDIIEMKGIPSSKGEKLWNAVKKEVDEYEENQIE